MLGRMKQAHFQPAAGERAPRNPDLAAIRVDRAQTELRHGRPIVLMPAEPDAPLLLAAAIETLGGEPLRGLRAWSNGLRLLVTAERAQALLGTEAGIACSLQVPATAGVETLQQLAAVSAGVIDAQALHDNRPATPTMQAALVLAKRAHLTPALLVAELPPASLAALEEALVLRVLQEDVLQAQAGRALSLRRVSDAHVPIAAHDDCTLVLFRETHGAAEHVAIIVGRPDMSQPVPVRLHSSCLTGDLLGSLRCDCGDQLQGAIDHLAQAGGVLLYLAQEGRGTGLANKLRAYRLQDGGLDTIDADRHLGFRDDERDFRAAVAMLQLLDIRRVRLLTNNPSKIEGLRRGGIEVVDRVALVAPVNVHNARYIQTKRDRAGHLSGC
jgi:GTP cyclohydrolase II